MKQLIISLGILSLYGLADTILTAHGLSLGLYEANPFVPVDHLFLHYIAVTAFIAVDAFAICAVGARVGWKLSRYVRGVVSLITLVYVYTLINNIIMIWRILNGYTTRG